MAQQTSETSRFERSGFAAAVTVGFGLFSILAMAPQSARALLIKDEGQPAAKAFSAVVPTLDPSRSQAELSLLNAAGVRTSSASAALTGGARPRSGSTGQPLLPGTLPSLLSSGPGAGPAGQSGSGASLGGPATGPLGNGASSPAGGEQSRGLTGTAPAAQGLPVPTAGAPANQAPVSAVPEPTTWAMMLLGFFAIGSAMRRREKPSQQSACSRA